MTNDASAILDDLLCRWHQWASDQSPVRGWPKRALVIGDYRAGRHNDSDDGTLDANLDDSTMKAVAFHVDELGEPFRSALHEEARNLTTGLRVWRSPRLPADALERHELVLLARVRLVERLHAAGVL